MPNAMMIKAPFTSRRIRLFMMLSRLFMMLSTFIILYFNFTGFYMGCDMGDIRLVSTDGGGPILRTFTKLNTRDNHDDGPRRGIKDELCPGCRFAKVGKMTCAKIIDHLMAVSSTKDQGIRKNLTLSEAALEVARNYPECHRCDPTACVESEKYYWRFDEPMSGRLFGVRTLMLQIPQVNRLPFLTPNNFTDYFSVPSHSQRNLSFEKRALWEYNPSIAILPEDQVPLDSGLHRNQSYYLASVRLSDYGFCFTPEQQETMGMHWTGDKVGMMILDANLSILMETVVSFGMDTRIFNLNGRLYMGSSVAVVPLWINPPANFTDSLRRLGPAIKGKPSDFEVFVDDPYLCCASGLCQGKNFNYFVDIQGRILVEIYPAKPHVVEVVDTANECELYDDGIGISQMNKYLVLSDQNDSSGIIYATGHVPRESFGTLDEIYFSKHGADRYPDSDERGTACCVKVNDPRQPGRELFVGISHNKIGFHSQYGVLMKKHPGIHYELMQYTSRFYAFETVPPFRLVAKSGKFCLDSARTDEVNENSNNVWIGQKLYSINHTNYTCPSIAFVSGLSESVDDPSQVIIGYGVNDCVPRLAKVRKDDLVYMLFMDQLPV